MNKERRKTISELQKRIDLLNDTKNNLGGGRQVVLDAYKRFVDAASTAWADLKTHVDAVKEEAESLKSDIEAIKDEEQEAFDNMPEGLQNGEKGETVTEAINKLQEAEDALGTIEDLDLPDFEEIEFPAIEDAMNAFDDARNMLEEASA